MSEPGLIQPEGITAAERYLQKLCNHSFLSLWSHMGIFREQRSGGKKTEGKELCDLLVVFGDDILIFSDKACAFKDTGNLDRDWSRWYKKAIEQSADQVWGAERWVKDFPNLLFLDRACTKPFPIKLPDPKTARFHRIVVAHNVKERCQKELGGSGSLMLDTSLIGCGRPFTVGKIDPARGFVHVLDDVTLDSLLQTLDTAIDFIRYLTKKEQFMKSGKKLFAAGEEDLLAVYLRDTNERGEHDFVLPSDHAGLIVPEGFWEDFQVHPQRLAQIEENRISYAWDRMIEHFNGHIIAGTQYRATHTKIGEIEPAMRVLSRESRLARRRLASNIFEMMKTTPRTGFRRTRAVEPIEPGGPFYMFLLYPQGPGILDEQYRLDREFILRGCCAVTKLMYPAAQEIVGIATGTKGSRQTSQDYLYRDFRIWPWTQEEREFAIEFQRDTGILTKASQIGGRVDEFPHPRPVLTKGELGKNPRNKSCPCGSGRKYKKCCYLRCAYSA